MTPAPTHTPSECAAEIRRAIFRLARRLRFERGADGLSINKTVMLSYLVQNGPKTLSELAAACGQQPQSLTRALAEMQEAGLVSRARGRQDRRQSFIAVTDTGRRALASEMAGCDNWLASALERLNETERQILRMAGQLVERIADMECCGLAPAIEAQADRVAPTPTRRPSGSGESSA
jgi:DNA-binding MarR family transcriptional regulator